MEKRLILASASPRRAELLKQVGASVTVMASAAEEDLDQKMPPAELAQGLAALKAKAVGQSVKDGLIIGADTIVIKGTNILGKPEDEEQAFAMLRLLSGGPHSVITGVAVLEKPSGEMTTAFAKTQVFFKSLSDAEIFSYISSGECFDKAGGYGIQGLGALLVEKIEGDYFNVVGLPLQLLNGILSHWGMNLLLEKTRIERGTPGEN